MLRMKFLPGKVEYLLSLNRAQLFGKFDGPLVRCVVVKRITERSELSRRKISYQTAPIVTAWYQNWQRNLGHTDRASVGILLPWN